MPVTTSHAARIRREGSGELDQRDDAGKGELVLRLNEWLDPRGVETHTEPIIRRVYGDIKNGELGTALAATAIKQRLEETAGQAADSILDHADLTQKLTDVEYRKMLDAQQTKLAKLVWAAHAKKLVERVEGFAPRAFRF